MSLHEDIVKLADEWEGMAHGTTQFDTALRVCALKVREAMAANPAPATEWGTDYWGKVEREPNEAHARSVAKGGNANLYSRPPMGQWALITGAGQ